MVAAFDGSNEEILYIAFHCSKNALPEQVDTNQNLILALVYLLSREKLLSRKKPPSIIVFTGYSFGAILAQKMALALLRLGSAGSANLPPDYRLQDLKGKVFCVTYSPIFFASANDFSEVEKEGWQGNFHSVYNENDPLPFYFLFVEECTSRKLFEPERVEDVSRLEELLSLTVNPLKPPTAKSLELLKFLHDKAVSALFPSSLSRTHASVSNHSFFPLGICYVLKKGGIELLDLKKDNSPDTPVILRSFASELNPMNDSLYSLMSFLGKSSLSLECTEVDFHLAEFEDLGAKFCVTEETLRVSVTGEGLACIVEADIELEAESNKFSQLKVVEILQGIAIFSIRIPLKEGADSPPKKILGGAKAPSKMRIRIKTFFSEKVVEAKEIPVEHAILNVPRLIACQSYNETTEKNFLRYFMSQQRSSGKTANFPEMKAIPEILDLLFPSLQIENFDSRGVLAFLSRGDQRSHDEVVAAYMRNVVQFLREDPHMWEATVGRFYLFDYFCHDKVPNPIEHTNEFLNQEYKKNFFPASALLAPSLVFDNSKTTFGSAQLEFAQRLEVSLTLLLNSYEVRVTDQTSQDDQIVTRALFAAMVPLSMIFSPVLFMVGGTMMMSGGKGGKSPLDYFHGSVYNNNEKVGLGVMAFAFVSLYFAIYLDSDKHQFSSFLRKFNEDERLKIYEHFFLPFQEAAFSHRLIYQLFYDGPKVNDPEEVDLVNAIMRAVVSEVNSKEKKAVLHELMGGGGKPEKFISRAIWEGIRARALHFELMKAQSKSLFIGVVGPLRVGKSSLPKKLFGIETNAGQGVENETRFISCYRVTEGIFVVDFPGANDNNSPEAVRNLYKKLIGSLDLLIVVTNMKNTAGEADATGILRDIITYSGCNTLVCLNKADVWLLDFENDYQRVPTDEDARKHVSKVRDNLVNTMRCLIPPRMSFSPTCLDYGRASDETIAKYKSCSEILGVQGVGRWLVDHVGQQWKSRLETCLCKDPSTG